MCEAVSGYICNMEIYSAEGKEVEDTVISNLGQNHHICQDNSVNSVRLTQTLLDTLRAKRGIQHDIVGEGKHLKKRTVNILEDI